MDYKKKLKLRLYTTVVYIALGVMMIAGVFETKENQDFLSAFGLALIVMGIVRIRNYFLITKDEETIKKHQIAETDERNLSILHNAKSTAFSAHFLLSGTAVIVLSLFGLHEAARWIAYCVLSLAVIYWICCWVYQKKL